LCAKGGEGKDQEGTREGITHTNMCPDAGEKITRFEHIRLRVRIGLTPLIFVACATGGEGKDQEGTRERQSRWRAHSRAKRNSEQVRVVYIYNKRVTSINIPDVAFLFG